LTFLTGTGRHRAQIAHFFRGQIGSWRSLGVGLVVGKRLRRLRHRCSSLEVSEPRPALPNDLRNRRNLARGGYSSSPVPDLQGQARLRHSFREFLFRGGRRARIGRRVSHHLCGVASRFATAHRPRRVELNPGDAADTTSARHSGSLPLSHGRGHWKSSNRRVAEATAASP